MIDQQQIQPKEIRSLGISEIESLPWGSHIIHFFRSITDLQDVVTPYIIKGLEQNEMCIWVISKPLTIKKAKEHLLSVFPIVDEYIHIGQLKILTDVKNYCPNDEFNEQKTISNFIDFEQQALKENYDGIRITGTSLWCKKHKWNELMEYEKKINNVIHERKMIALCSYPYQACDLSDFVEATIHHQLVLIRVDGKLQSFLTQQELLERLKKEEKRYIQLLESEVNQRTGEIQHLLKQKDDFINQLGHDLKNPLGPLLNLIPVLQKKTNDPDCTMILDILQRNVYYMRKLVHKTIKLAQLNSPHFLLTKQQINLTQEIGETLLRNQTSIQSKKISIHFQNKVDLIAYGDHIHISEVLNNLINNAVKYSNKNGIICINASTDNEKIVISIKDNGVGISEDQMELLFDEYYKADPSRHDFESNGLGLPICKRIIQMHGGEIWAESEGLGKGSAFYFSIPYQKDNGQQSSCI